MTAAHAIATPGTPDPATPGEGRIGMRRRSAPPTAPESQGRPRVAGTSARGRQRGDGFFLDSIFHFRVLGI